MTAHEIVALKCPSCGSGANQPSREMSFGAEFRCGHCHATSVLIVDGALIALGTLQALGETVCTSCGRTARGDARFCQEGHSLVRKCINKDCLKEFSIDHQRCDFCGWPQQVVPGTSESVDLEVDRAILDLMDPSVHVVIKALGTIRSAGSAGVKAVPSIIAVLSDKRRAALTINDGSVEEVCWTVLATMGPAATDAVPLLLQRIDEVWTNPQSRDLCLQVLATISPPAALPLLKKGLDECLVGNGPWTLTNAAKIVGKAAIPTLQEFCSVFGSVRSTGCKETISEIRKNGRYVAWSWTRPGTWIKE